MKAKLQAVAVSMFPFTAEEVSETESVYDPQAHATVTKEVRYLRCTIQPFDPGVVTKAFGIRLDDPYGSFSVTNGQAMDTMAKALKLSLFGSLENGQSVPLNDAELLQFSDGQCDSEVRQLVLTTALSLVGKVPYFWGGKSPPGWNNEWNTPKVVTAEGSGMTGTFRPFGLDCSGFTSWVYQTALGIDIGGGTSGQFPNTAPITAAQLLPGDLGFLPSSDGWSHVLIFAGLGDDGERMWVHSTGGSGVILNSPSYEGNLQYRRLKVVDYDSQIPGK